MIAFRNSIAFRLFMVTFVVIMLFVSLLLALLSSGFSTFYEQRQTSEVAKALKAVGERYRYENNDDGPGMPSYLTQFESDYYAKVAVLEVNRGVVQAMLTGGSSPGQQIMLRGGLNGVQLPSDTEMFLVPTPPLQSELEGIMLAAKDWSSDDEALRGVIGQGETVIYRTQNSTTEEGSSIKNQLIAVTPVTGDGGDSGVVLLALSSLQPVTNASSVFNGLSVYVFGAAFIFVLILSFVYALIITKPLVSLNALAGRLANLDFRDRVRWKRKDEIGELARSFDFLAENLQRTLGELQSANEKLREDIEREKRLEKMRRDFIAGVSHELKTPLSLIGGYAEGLKDNIASVKREKYADVILEETRRMSVIVGDMLDLSHLESGQYRLKLEQISVEDLIKEAAERARAISEDKNVKIMMSTKGDGEITAIADWFRIGQVLTNLVSNAVRHTSDGGVLEIAAVKREEEWHLSVYNEGLPIPEEEIPRIWGQFYRTDKARSRESGGTGIGLAIVRQILELHGSRYEVYNGHNGVTFSFTLRVG